MTGSRESIAVAIPAYRPDGTLIRLVEALLPYGFGKIVIVDDGSGGDGSGGDCSGDDAVFAKLPAHEDLVLLRHPENRGKGAALKTAFAHLTRDDASDIRAIVTADADGQHLPADIARIADAAAAAPDHFIFGARRFEKGVPLRSRIGNLATRAMLGWIRKINLRDTQTGLRAYPVALARALLGIEANRYDFEFRAILKAAQLGVRFRETPIETVYEPGNPSSHFRPLLDSMRIYAVFARFLAVSLSSFAIDITAFAVFLSMTGDIYVSTLAARAISCCFNFLGNKYAAFRAFDRKRLFREIAGYLSLVLLVAFASAALVDAVTGLAGAPVVATKIAVDTALFFSNFLIQRFVLFRTPAGQSSVRR